MKEDNLIEKYMNNFSKNLKQLRVLNDLSRSDLANQLGMTPTNYGYYETGTRKPPLEKIIQIAKYFKVSLDELIGYSLNELELCRGIANKAGFKIYVKDNGSVDIYIKPLNGDYEGMAKELADKMNGPINMPQEDFIKIMNSVYEMAKKEEPRIIRQYLSSNLLFLSWNIQSAIHGTISPNETPDKRNS